MFCSTDFRIGFENNQIEKIEGESISLTIVQTNDVVGQLRTNDTLSQPNLNNIPSSARGKRQVVFMALVIFFLFQLIKIIITLIQWYQQ